MAYWKQYDVQGQITQIFAKSRGCAVGAQQREFHLSGCRSRVGLPKKPINTLALNSVHVDLLARFVRIHVAEISVLWYYHSHAKPGRFGDTLKDHLAYSRPRSI